MKRTLLIGFLLTLLCYFEAPAQRQYLKPLKSTNQSILGFSNYNIGVKMGCPWSYISKSDLKETSMDGHFGYLFGMTAERNLDKWSVALEADFAQKGARMHNEKTYQISMAQNGILKTKYQVAYNVAAIRIPVTYYFKGMVKDDKVVPYVFAGPEVSIPLGFNLDLWNLSLDREVTALTQRFDGPIGADTLSIKTEAFSPGINVSVVAGLGLMTKVRFENSAVIFKLDAAYNRGLMNLGVATEEAWKWPFEKQEERIFAHDIEINFSVVFPIKKILHDACYNFKK